MPFELFSHLSLFSTTDVTTTVGDPIFFPGVDATFWLLAVWFVMEGGTIGSFLNVVIYRVPAGMSLSRPGSHCPLCGHAIRPWDNVPVFGWLLLRGKCRDCRAPISPRYPLIEVLCAAMFLAVFLAGALVVVRSGVIVPEGQSILPMLLIPMAATPTYFLTLLCTLLAAAMIQVDGHRARWRLFLPCLVVGVLAPLLLPSLRPMVRWDLVSAMFREGPAGDWLAGRLVVLFDLVCGTGVGVIAGGVMARFEPLDRRGGLFFGAVCIGMLLGWLPIVFVAVVAELLRGLFAGLRRGKKQSIPTTIWLLVAAGMWVLCLPFWGN